MSAITSTREIPVFTICSCTAATALIPYLNWVQRCAFAELLAGNMKTHILYAVRDDNRTNTLAVPDTADTIPVMRDNDGPSLAAQIQPGMSLKVDMEGVQLSLPLPALAAPILALTDGERSLVRIHADLQSSQNPGLGHVQKSVRPAFQLVLRSEQDVPEETRLKNHRRPVWLSI